ncbi:MAG: 16S rRNA (cytidine(1402)-2'-O)-methyltransferase [Gammaproteobacteria bacterium]|nr:16S rRNA (cytidine(1402)-2'-O)-methyltransferase [Gammaproteobacteria bacterium]
MGDKLSTLYVVATPIGNLGDISQRAIEVLSTVDVIAAEDTRHTGKLLSEFSISSKLIALHDHNEDLSTARIIQMLEDGQNIAMVSDAGTPLISDPGYHLVNQCLSKGIDVVAVPGPSSVTAALSIAGMPTNRFSFEGFVPAKTLARREFLTNLKFETRTQVFFESPHRINETLRAMAEIMGPGRQLSLCRELTKTFEQVVLASVGELSTRIGSGDIPSKGEFVLVLRGSDESLAVNADHLLQTLLAELSPSKAASVAAKVTDLSKSDLYNRALVLKKGADPA